MQIFSRELLIKHRLAAGISRYRLAQIIGVSKSALYMLEKGKRGAPRISTLQDIAVALGKRVEDFFEERG